MRLRSLGLATDNQEAEEWTEARVIKFIKTGNRIGRGGVGVVYANPSMDDTVAIKVSASRSTCRDFEGEYKIAKAIHDAATSSSSSASHSSYENPYSLSRVVEIVKELPAIELEPGFKHCALVMQLVHRPSDLPHENDSALSYQAYIAKPSYDKVVPGRGIYLGAEQIVGAIKPHTLEQLATSLGSLLGMLHYRAKCDANDMEYLLGYIVDDDDTDKENGDKANSGEKKDKKIQIVALDFDRVRFYTVEQMKSSEVLEHYYWSIDQEYYFPKPDQQPLYDRFKTAYLAEADNNGLLDVAQLVIAKYESENSR